MKSHRIRLLVTLVLFAVIVAATWTTSPAHARPYQTGAPSISTSGLSSLGLTKTGAPISGSEPDVGSQKNPPATRDFSSPSVAGLPTLNRVWNEWASRIWLSLFWIAAR